jgi:predicted O-methyltransferase YrrM
MDMRLKNTPKQIQNTTRSMWRSFVPGAPMGDLHRSLGRHQLYIEGYLGREQATFFRRLLAKDPTITKILEVGFNAGHSSYLFLSARPDVTVVSFDLGAHRYVARAKAFLDMKFPGRHTLVLGDSREMVPRYQADHESAAFDLTFIDGGHEYEVAIADIRNCQAMAKPSGLVVMDDLQQWQTWGVGPVRAWSEAKQLGMIEELQLVQDGRTVTEVRRKLVTHAWALGRYFASAQPSGS